MQLSLDLGTGSLKAVLVHEGQIIGQSSVAYTPHAPYPNWSESPPSDWWNAAAQATRQALRHIPPKRIQHITLSGQMHGVVLTDEHGTAIRPAILWSDTRATHERRAYEQLPASQRQRLANPIVPGMAGLTLLWLQTHEANVIQHAQRLLLPKDWLRRQLTGRDATDPSDASGTLLYDLQYDTWHRDVISALHLPSRLLPPIQPSSAEAGHLQPAAAQHLGLHPGTPVLTGAADTAAAILGVNLKPDETLLTVGSGAQLVQLSATFQPAPAHGLHLYRTAQPSGYYLMAAVQNAGLALEWVRRLFHIDWETFYAEAQQAPSGSRNLIFLPHLTGERTPHLNPHAFGAWLGARPHHERQHFLRASLEGVALAIDEAAQALSKQRPMHAARLAGGGTAHPFWQQLLANTLRVPLHPIGARARDASAVGAALLAAPAQPPNITTRASTIEPRQDPALDDARERFRCAYQQLQHP